LTVPPEDIALKYTSAVSPSDGKIKKYTNSKAIKGNAFMLCAMINALNSAAIYYKDHHCDKATANYEYSYVFHKDMTYPDDAN